MRPGIRKNWCKMPTPKLSCPHAVYREEMRIFCLKMNDYCGNCYYKRCKGWWVLTDKAAACPIRKGE